MNKFLAIGRLTDEPNIKYNNELCIARYTLAVDRNFKSNNDSGTDYIHCVAFNKSAEFAEKYLSKGKKIAIEGRIQTGSYENKKGDKVYTTDIIVNSQEFVESKSQEKVTRQAEPKPQPKGEQPSPDDDFMQVPDDNGLPFNF